jgi:hypothetical protein
VRDPGGEGKEAGAECMQDASKWGTDILRTANHQTVIRKPFAGRQAKRNTDDHATNKNLV